MRRLGLHAVFPRPRTSEPHPEHRIYPYLLRDLQITRPNHVWCTDVTYISLQRGFLYLVAVMDWASRKVLSWRLSTRHVHTVFDVDFSHVDRLRDSRKGSYEQAGAKLTYLSFVAKAVIEAISDVPVVNASLDGGTIMYKDDVNLGIAVALDWGLIVPVITRAQDRNLVDLSRAIGDLAERARTKRLTPRDVEGGTFTITNPGTFGSILSMPIINQPQLAILSLGVVEIRPIVVGDAVEVRRQAYLTLGFDHRIIDGAVADRFMVTVKRTLERFDERWL